MQKSTLYFLLKQRHIRLNHKSRKSGQFFSGAARLTLIVLLIAFFGVVFWGSWEYARVSANLPDPSELKTLLDRRQGELLTPTRIYDRTGQILLAEVGSPSGARTFLSTDPADQDHFSPELVTVTVALLEPDFWSGSGVQTTNLTDPKPATIAERLVQGLFLTSEPESSLRALRMRLLTAQVIHQYSKTQILEWFLNSAALGHDTFGVEAASQLYLGKSARDLTLAESALMVGLMDSPALNPLDSKAAALDLQKTVLTTLEQRGSIPADQLRHARQETLTFKTEPALQANPYSAFIQHLKEQLEPYLGTNRLERGGLVIRSTLDVNLQSQLRCAALTQLFRIESTALGGVASEPQNCPAALLLPTQSYSEPRSGLAIRGIVVDSSSGQVLAYLPPSTQFGDTLTDDRVQPGSLLAPIIALSGFAHGESPSSLMWDIPSSLPADLAGTGNPDAAFHGPVSLRMAVANDYLVPLASLAEQIGPSTVWQMGASLGLNSLANSTPSVRGLFAGEPVPLLELSQVYATLASSGVRSGAVNPLTKQIDLSMVLQVNSVSQRQLLNLETPQKLSIVSDSLAYLVNHVLSDDAARRPELGYPNLLEISRPAAAKLGETQSKDQVWTAGYTPDRVVLIGIQSTPESGNSAPPQPLMAAGVWNAIIQTASSGLPATGWSQPSGVTTQRICSPSGLLPTEACPNVVNEVFLAGNEPVQADNLYRRVMINRETGLLATVFTPPALVEAKVTMDVPVEARDWALAAGLPLTPTGYDAIRVPVPDPRVQITSPALFATVQGIVEIRGTATDTAFKSYSIQVGEGINPSNWVQVGEVHTTPVTDGVLATWNTGSLDGLYAIRLTVVDQANQIKTAVIQVTVDGVPPQAVILSPQPEAQISPVMGVITFSARVSDNTAISRVEWWLDGKKIQETGVSPYSCVWQAVSGRHELFLKAWDIAGNAATSAKVTFTVTQ